MHQQAVAAINFPAHHLHNQQRQTVSMPMANHYQSTNKWYCKLSDNQSDSPKSTDSNYSSLSSASSTYLSEMNNHQISLSISINMDHRRNNVHCNSNVPSTLSSSDLSSAFKSPPILAEVINKFDLNF